MPKIANFKDALPQTQPEKQKRRRQGGGGAPPFLIASGQGGGEAFRIPVGHKTRMSGPAVLREEEEHRRSCNKSQREEEALVSLGVEPGISAATSGRRRKSPLSSKSQGGGEALRIQILMRRRPPRRQWRGLRSATGPDPQDRGLAGCAAR